MKYTKFLRDILLGIENLLLHKLRSFLTMLGVVFGVGSVVAATFVTFMALDYITELKAGCYPAPRHRQFQERRLHLGKSADTWKVRKLRT